VDILFTAQAIHPVTFRVRDENNQPTIAAFVIRDAQGRIYPPQSKRLAPDFSFHPQVYRADGEAVRLPPGTYQIELSRGPESLVKNETLKVDGQTTEATFRTARWIDPSRYGWWSGDHHIHAAGCAHYTKPSEGVHAPDMFRHWHGGGFEGGSESYLGPVFRLSKAVFSVARSTKFRSFPTCCATTWKSPGLARTKRASRPLAAQGANLSRGNSSQHWPKLGLNTLKWAKRQGAVVGPAHSGWGLQVQGDELPTFKLPKFDGIGANEYIVDVTHEVPAR
jgi:hypothetical protein